MREQTMKASASVWVGRVLSGLFVLFMLGASVAPKLMGMPIAGDILEGLGWRRDYVLPIGILEMVLTLLYAYRPTSVLGAVLFMGLLGGAMATNLRADQPLFSHTLFSIYLALFMWSGLWLRDEKLRALFPWRRKDA
jgi:DoxX-like family